MIDYSSSLLQGGRCGIYSVNCPKWVISMQVNHRNDHFWQILSASLLIITSSVQTIRDSFLVCYIHIGGFVWFFIIIDEVNLIRLDVLSNALYKCLMMWVSQACNAHGLYCVPLYDSLGMSSQSSPLFVPHPPTFQKKRFSVWFTRYDPWIQT